MDIRPLGSPSEAETCARMMAGSEPWLTLGRGHDEALSLLTNPEREVYIAHRGGVIAGSLVLNMRGAFVGYINSICVAPGMRGLGLGRRIIEFAEERIFRESPNVFLCVSDFNHGARRFYERLGYQVVGELRDYVVKGHSEILMRKSLGPTSGYHSRL